MAVGYVFGCDQMGEIRSKRDSAQLHPFPKGPMTRQPSDQDFKLNPSVEPINGFSLFFIESITRLRKL